MELNRDGDGFLINTSDWSEEVMYQMAESDGMEITEEIKTYIDRAREMYNETGQFLLFVILQKNLEWIERQVNYMMSLNQAQ